MRFGWSSSGIRIITSEVSIRVQVAVLIKMSMKISNTKQVFNQILKFIGFGLLFGIIYAQSPVYTSNQNQYFLHGLAAAGFGNLDVDWLANTIDPTPVFSSLIYITFLIAQNEVIFYLYYIVLMAIYLFSLIGVIRIIFNLQDNESILLFITTLVIIHSAALRFFLGRGIGEEWTFVLEGGVAGQRVLGAVFQPSTFGVLLVLSLYLFLKDNLILALIAVAGATYFHPTYLLSAGILVSAYLGTIIVVDHNIRKAILVGFFAFVLVSPVVIYVFQSFGTTSQDAQQAQAILVHFRIPHHAVISDWLDRTTLVQLGLVSISLWLVRRTRLFPVLLISIMIALTLTIIQVITTSNALALIFPWRISVILVPLATVIIIASIAQAISVRYPAFLERNSRLIEVSCGLALGLVAIAGGLRFGIEYIEKDQATEQAMYQFVRVTQGEEEVYLVPTKMQDFRLETGAPIYVDFKSIPYLDNEVLEWYRRILLATEFYADDSVDCNSLERFHQEGISRVILEDKKSPLSCKTTQEIYRDSYYGIYQINNP